MWVGGRWPVPPAVHRVWYSAEHGLGCVPSCVAGFSAPGSHFVLEGKLRPLLEISPQTRLTPNVPSAGPGILKKKKSSLKPPSLDKQGQYHRYFYYFLALTSQAHFPTVPSSTNQTTQPPSGLRGENYNSQNGLRPGGLPKEPLQFQASRVPLSLAFKATRPPEVRGGDWLAAPAAQDPRGGDGACVVLGAMSHLLPGP